jgi:stage II sporulation protein D
MPADWPEAALRAQAIAARSYAYFELIKARKEAPEQSFDVDDTIFSQAYTGLAYSSTRSDVAILSTSGRLMTSGGEVIKAYFHADSGGHTEDSFNVWNIAFPYAVGKPEQFDPKLDPNNSWRVELTLDSIRQSLATAGLLGDNANALMGLRVLSQDINRSGRAEAVSLTLRDSSQLKIAATVFAHAVCLRSTMFSIDRPDAKQPRIVITGKGFGHGVGMSQVGAKILAAALGWHEDEILSFYYTGIEITPSMPQPRLRQLRASATPTNSSGPLFEALQGL